MGVYRGCLVYCHSRPVVTCWAPSVGRRDMTINTVPSMICHSSHITQLLHKAAKNICDIVFYRRTRLNLAQLSHVTIWSILKMSLTAMTAVQTLILQRSKYNEEKTDDRVFGTCVRLSSCWHHLIKDIRSGTIWTSGGVTWSYGPMAGLPLSSLCHLIGGYLVNF